MRAAGQEQTEKPAENRSREEGETMNGVPCESGKNDCYWNVDARRNDIKLRVTGR